MSVTPWDILAAACSRPLSGPAELHSLAMALAALAQGSACPPVNGVEDVQKVLRAFPADPRIAPEDCHALSPDWVWRGTGDTLRFHPGAQDQPLRDLRSVLMAAAAFDRFLLPELGFGISDLAELVLRHSDAVLRSTARTAKKRLSPEEVRTYGSTRLVDSVQLCPHPARAAAALEWATFDGPPGWNLMAFDDHRAPGLRWRGEDVVLDTPVAFLLDALTALTGVLAEAVAATYTGARLLYRLVVEAELEAALSAEADITEIKPGRFRVNVGPRRHFDVALVTILADPPAGPAMPAGTDILLLEMPSWGNPPPGLAIPPGTPLTLPGLQQLERMLATRSRSEDIRLFLDDISNHSAIFGQPLDLWSLWLPAGGFPGRADAIAAMPRTARPFGPELERATDAFPSAHRALGHQVRQRVARRAAPTRGKHVYRGAEASRFQRDVHLPAAREVFLNELSKYDGPLLLPALLGRLEAVVPLRLGPSGTDDGALRAEREASLALEASLAFPPTGTLAPDALDVELLCAAAGVWVEAAIDSEVAGRELAALEVVVDELGVIRRKMSPARIDFEAYTEARREHRGPWRSLPPLPTWPNGMFPPGRLPDSPAWQALLTRMRSNLGFDLADVVRVLDATISLEAEAIPRSHLDNWAAGLGGDPVACTAAVAFLTLTGSAVAAEGVDPGRTTERSHRLLTRPFVEVGPGCVWVSPALAAMALVVLGSRLAEGRLPWPATAVGKPVDDAAAAWRNDITESLEVELREQLAGLGYPHRVKVAPGGASVSCPGLRGEVDGLVANTDTRVLWVLEAKDPAEVFSPGRLSGAVGTFESKYFDQLDRAVRSFKENCPRVLTRLGVTDTAGWRVAGLMVTRDPVGAAFIKTPPFRFSTVANLAPALAADGRTGGRLSGMGRQL